MPAIFKSVTSRAPTSIFTAAVKMARAVKHEALQPAGVPLYVPGLPV